MKIIEILFGGVGMAIKAISDMISEKKKENEQINDLDDSMDKNESTDEND